MKANCFIFLVSFVCLSCSEAIDASFLNTPTETVLVCTISPSDTIIKAVLSKATSFSNTETPYGDLFIKDAQIQINNGIVQKQFTYNATKYYYELAISKEFKIEKGVSYSIKATTKEGKLLTSTCTVPLKSYMPEEIEIEKSFRGSDLVDIRLKWLKNKDELYMIKPYFFYSNAQVKDRPIAQKVQFFNSSDIIESKVITKYFTNDLSFGGKKNTVFFYVVDKNFFNYFKSVQLNNNNLTDPFSQPINVKYNINGGFGCFGAYNITRIDYEL